MNLPEIPKELQGLYPLEWRLLSPRLPFMKMYAVPRARQYKNRGNVVNVPADVANTVQSLPRMSDDLGTIKVQLKRHLKFKHSVMSQNIRPEKVRSAAEYFEII